MKLSFAALAAALAFAAPARADEPPPDLTLLRVDLEDGFALHPWIFHEVRLSERFGVLGTLHAQTPGANPALPPFLELDVGPVFHLGGLQINPALGVDLIWDDDETRATDLILQTYLLFSNGKLSVESWNLYFIPLRSGGLINGLFQGRQYATYKVWGELALGPHLEETYTFRATHSIPAGTPPADYVGTGLDRFAVGGDVSYGFRWGQLTLFVASERKRKALEMRLTFLREL